LTETVEFETDGAVDRGDEAGDSRLITKWLSVRVLKADEKLAEGVDDDSPGGTLTLVASTSHEDRAGDVISASGWDLAAYRDNPVFLWAHDYRRPAIGKSVRTWVQDGPDGGRLMAEIEFAPTPFAQEIRLLYASGFMRGVSVGFRALEMEPRTGAGGRRGVLFKRQELLEISAAPVPVNSGALARGPRGLGGHGFLENPKDAERSLASVTGGTEPPGAAEQPEIRDAMHQIREFWKVLAALTGDEKKSLEADRVGG
jgi:hypothetical protein